MAVRTTVDIPEPLHQVLRAQSVRAGDSKAIEQAYAKPPTGRMLTGPLIEARGKYGPDFPGDKNPHDFIFS